MKFRAVGQKRFLPQPKEIMPHKGAEISGVYPVLSSLCDLPSEPAFVLRKCTFRLISIKIFMKIALGIVHKLVQHTLPPP